MLFWFSARVFLWLWGELCPGGTVGAWEPVQVFLHCLQPWVSGGLLVRGGKCSWSLSPPPSPRCSPKGSLWPSTYKNKSANLCGRTNFPRRQHQRELPTSSQRPGDFEHLLTKDSGASHLQCFLQQGGGATERRAALHPSCSLLLVELPVRPRPHTQSKHQPATKRSPQLRALLDQREGRH